MPIKTKEELYRYYQPGDKTTEGQWFDLIDSLFNIMDDGHELIPYTFTHTLFVDSGATETPVKGQIVRPYPTPDAALLDATTGDLIVIFPGSYNCGNLFKDGISYYAFPGVILINDDTSPSFALFSDSSLGVAGTCRMFGYAELQITNFATEISLAGTVFELECEKITYLHQSGGYVPLFFLANAAYTRIKTKHIDCIYSFVRLFAISEMSADIYCDLITSVYPNSIAEFTCSLVENVVWNVHIHKIEHSLNIDSVEILFNVLALPLTNRPAFNFFSSIINSYNVSLISTEGVDTYLNDVRFISKGGVWDTSSYVFSQTQNIPGTLGFLSIKNSEVIMEHAITPTDQRVFNPLSLATYKIIGTLTTNMPLSGPIPFMIGEYVYDADFSSN